MIFVGCREEVFPRNIYRGCYLLDNGDLYSQLASNVDQAVWFIFFGILVLVLLPMLDDYSNGCARAHSMRLKLKLWENPRWYLQVYGLDLCLVLCGFLWKSKRLRHGRRIILKTSMIC
jgi:hypothetical protein